jgi:hypothetical protein
MGVLSQEKLESNTQNRRSAKVSLGRLSRRALTASRYAARGVVESSPSSPR